MPVLLCWSCVNACFAVLTLYSDPCFGRRVTEVLLAGDDVESAAILTPYAGQVRLLMRLARCVSQFSDALFAYRMLRGCGSLLPASGCCSKTVTFFKVR